MGDCQSASDGEHAMDIEGQGTKMVVCDSGWLVWLSLLYISWLYISNFTILRYCGVGSFAFDGNSLDGIIIMSFITFTEEHDSFTSIHRGHFEVYIYSTLYMRWN